jgi:Family of unknown function (DUF6049)
MARRASGALAAVFALAVVALPAALVAAAVPAEAETAQAGQSPSVMITGLSPQWAGPGTTVTVTGTVTNSSPTQRRLIVQLLDSGTPVSSVAELQHSASGAFALANLILPTATWESGLLRPGASASWSIQLPTSAMTSFGVYPVAAQVEDAFGTPLNWTESFLPYVPAKTSPDGSTVPAAQKIAWVWPVIDQPLLAAPWQDSCTGSQAAALARSVSTGGRLDQLLDAAASPVRGATPAAVQSEAVTSEPGHQAQSQTARAQQPQSLASYDGLTWAIDPAVAANVAALAQCGARQPQWSQAASTWLARLKGVTANQSAFVTAYGDPDMASLIGAGLAADVQHSFRYGRSQASQILDRNLSPVPAGTTPTGQAAATDLAWLADAQVSYGTLENLAAVDGVGTVLLSSSAFPAAQTSVLRTLDGNGSYLNVLLANNSLTSLLGSATRAPGSGFETVQDFLAETALMAEQGPAAPIIVAPPQRWQPPPGLAADLLNATASAPWLSPASLTSLTAAKNIPTVQAPTTVGGTALSQTELGQLDALDGAVTQMQLLRASLDPDLYLAVSTVESSAYAGRFKGTALAMIAVLTTGIAQEEQSVHIVAENRVTLGGLHGSVPVSIDNGLGYPVQVALRISYDATSGTRVTVSSPAALTVPAHTAKTVRVQVSAAQTGSTTISLALTNRKGELLAVQPVRMTVQTTQVGLLGLIIFAAALGVFLLASAARAMRRGGPPPTGGESASPAPSGDERSGQSTEEAAPDSVVPEHSGLGTAPTPRPR